MGKLDGDRSYHSKTITTPYGLSSDQGPCRRDWTAINYAFLKQFPGELRSKDNDYR
jgi:hypothetical protein